MKVLVPIKRVVDYNVRVHPLPDASGVDVEHAKMSVNPFCEIAVEEAVRWREKGLVSEVVVVAVGGDKCQEQLRAAMALGADSGVLVQTAQSCETLVVARALCALVQRLAPRLVICGKQSIDGENNQTGQMLAGLLGWPQATFASRIEWVGAEQLEVTREVDGGLRRLALDLPAVITTDLRLNEPRYAILPNIMKAKKKPLEIVPLETLVEPSGTRVELLQVGAPEPRQAGIKVESVAELVEKLRHEAKVIS